MQTRYLKSSTGSFTVTESHDALNRLVQRVVPSRTYSTSTINGVQFPYYSTPSASISGSTVTVAGDTQTFAYDSVGNLKQADNRYARIRRTYTKNGAIEKDSLALRNYNDSTVFTNHVYTLRYTYNLDGQLKEIIHTTWLSPGNDKTTYAYDGATGRLSSVTDALGGVYAFAYDGNGQPTSIAFPGGSRTMTYDAIRRPETVSVSTSGYSYGGSHTYDPAGRILNIQSADDGGAVAYNGFGHVTSSNVGSDADAVESFERNAFGQASLYQRTAWQGPGKTSINHYLLPGGGLTTQEGTWAWDEHPDEPLDWEQDQSEYSHDGRGNVTSRWNRSLTWQPIGNPDPWDRVQALATQEHRGLDYYAADGKLAVSQIARDSTEHRYDSNGNYLGDYPGQPSGAFEEYWYDALGRRVLKRTRQELPLW